ncbi:unnamed protein product [Pylaiella littoralis]
MPLLLLLFLGDHPHLSINHRQRLALDELDQLHDGEEPPRDEDFFLLIRLVTMKGSSFQPEGKVAVLCFYCRGQGEQEPSHPHRCGPGHDGCSGEAYPECTTPVHLAHFQEYCQEVC